MESYEVLRAAVEKVGAKQVAHDLGVSTSLVYKWCEVPKGEAGDDQSGARNPLDRLWALVRSTGDSGPVAWLCHQAGGFLVDNPEPGDRPLDAEYVSSTNHMLQDFSSLLSAVSESIADDGLIDAAEARRIREQWQRLKAYAEAFVVACEQGLFAEHRSPR